MAALAALPDELADHGGLFRTLQHLTDSPDSFLLRLHGFQRASSGGDYPPIDVLEQVVDLLRPRARFAVRPGLPGKL
eukprot:6164850-Pyramimonas_sp.AAC.1